MEDEIASPLFITNYGCKFRVRVSKIVLFWPGILVEYPKTEPLDVSPAFFQLL
jgi:hypothetical protein